jgi:hypothetical protein
MPARVQSVARSAPQRLTQAQGICGGCSVRGNRASRGARAAGGDTSPCRGHGALKFAGSTGGGPTRRTSVISKAQFVWRGSACAAAAISGKSDALEKAPHSLTTRFESGEGRSPEEMLARKGFKPDRRHFRNHGVARREQLPNLESSPDADNTVRQVALKSAAHIMSVNAWVAGVVMTVSVTGLIGAVQICLELTVDEEP